MNRVNQPKKMARGLKFRIKKVDNAGFYYLCSETKALISCAVIWAIVFIYAKSRFSHDMAQIC